MATRTTNQVEKEKSTFQWSDDEVELLQVIHDYKTYHAGESTDWEKVATKYSDIRQRFRSSSRLEKNNASKQ